MSNPDDRQRFMLYMIEYQADFASKGNHAEQLVSTLLGEVVKAIRGGYVGELVVLVREWAKERRKAQDGQANAQ